MEVASRPSAIHGTTSFNSIPLTTSTMASTDDSQYLALGDVHADNSSPQVSSFDDTDVMLGTPPPPVIIQSRPAKKRKSWGQELPEPKTTLPPRKRAKTDDEKEQRRIERIKRNRAAAHNSRERKRQETETLAVALARANAELDAYRKLHGPLPASIVLPEVTLCTEEPETPVPSLSDSRSPHDSALSPATPESMLHINDHVDIKQEPIDLTSSISFSPKYVSLDRKPSTAAFEHFDPTQHSAAMLCDLQCRSNPLSSTSSGRSPVSTSTTTSWWTRTFLYIMTLQLQQCYRTLMMALWTISPSRMARLTQLSAIRSSLSTTSSTTPRLSRSTLGRLALSRTATGPSAPLRRGALAPRRLSSLEAQCTRMAGSMILYKTEHRRMESMVETGVTSQTSDGRRRHSTGVAGSDSDSSDILR